MKSPITGKEMILIQEPAFVMYKGTKIPYMSTYYLCPTTGDRYTDTTLDTYNMEKVEYAYKKLHELNPTDNVVPMIIILSIIAIILYFTFA